MIKEITEKQAYKLAEGATEWPIVVKEEDEQTESAVALKIFPTGYLLGVSCDTQNMFKLYFSEDFCEISELCNTHLRKLRELGNPFLK